MTERRLCQDGIFPSIACYPVEEVTDAATLTRHTAPFPVLGGLGFRPAFLHGQATEPAIVPGGAEELPYPRPAPPLVDREIFFGNPEISGGQLSPDGRWVSFVKPLDGIRNVWVKSIDEPFEAARPMTADSLRPIQGHSGARTKVILFVQDQGGNENFHAYLWTRPRSPPRAWRCRPRAT